MVMVVVIIIAFLICLAVFPLWQFLARNMGRIIVYAPKDIFRYIKARKWKKFEQYGIYIYGGLYGKGKTLSIVEYVNFICQHYDNVRIISNIDLKNVPYTKFEYFEQLMERRAYDNECIIYVIDEIGSLMNARNYKNNRIGETQFLYTLNQIRKDNKTLLLASQRFGMCDKNFRQCAVQWIECSKFWRIVRHTIYDPYDLECTLNPKLVAPIAKNRYFFATDKLFASYNTRQLVEDFKDKFDKGKFNPIIVEPTNNDIQGNLTMAGKLTRKGKRRIK